MTTLKIITLRTALFAGVSPAMAQSRLQMGNERPVHHRIAHPRPQRYDAVPRQNSGDCSPVHPPFCRHICTGSGPCAPLERCLKVPQERLCY